MGIESQYLGEINIPEEQRAEYGVKTEKSTGGANSS